MRAFTLADGSVVRYHDLPGPGRPLVFVHGLGCASSCDYPRVAAAPALADRRRLLIDLLGAGFSDRPEAFGYGVADHARVLAELIDGLGVAPVDVYGHSMGGSAAIVLAGRVPGRVARLVVSEPNLVAGGGAFSRPIAAQDERRFVERGFSEALAGARATGNLVWAGSLQTWAPAAVHRGARSLVEGERPSWLEQLLALQIPRAALYGARSLPDADAGRLERAGVPIRLVADAGHSMAWENPTGLAEAIAAALGGG